MIFSSSLGIQVHLHGYEDVHHLEECSLLPPVMPTVHCSQGTVFCSREEFPVSKILLRTQSLQKITGNSYFNFLKAPVKLLLPRNFTLMRVSGQRVYIIKDSYRLEVDTNCLGDLRVEANDFYKSIKSNQ